MSQDICVCRVHLRWADTDRYGHINNVQVMQLLEEARVIAFERWFGEHHTMLDDGVVVAWHRIEYVNEMPYQTRPIAVETWVSGVKAAQFTINYVVKSDDSPEAAVYARAQTGLATYDIDQRRPRRIPTDTRESLRQHERPPVDMRTA